MHYMYGRVYGDGRAALRLCHAQFPDQRMPGHGIFKRLHHQLRETRLFHVTRHDAGQRRAVRSSSLEESTLNAVADRPESSTRAVAHHLSVGHQIICRELKENRLHLFHLQRAQALNKAWYSGRYSKVRCCWTS
ncbi:uncharacterized protein TNCV_2284011 [Trichonephila clavipes]|nr:uncharacterized protein TNCV_2284011 [Trichonephila clavipes]